MVSEGYWSVCKDCRRHIEQQRKKRYHVIVLTPGQGQPRTMNNSSRKYVYAFGRQPIGGTTRKPLLKSHNASLTGFTRQTACLGRLSQGLCVVLIVDLPGCETEAMELIACAGQAIPRVPALALVARGNVSPAVDAMKAGACDCLEKPVQKDRLRTVVKAQLEQTAASAADSILTAGERQVSPGTLAGRTSSEIGAEWRERRIIQRSWPPSPKKAGNPSRGSLAYRFPPPLASWDTHRFGCPEYR
jgi:CheY-like chemotaxis protein